MIDRLNDVINAVQNGLSEIVFLIGLTLLSIGGFMIGPTVGIIATGVILVGLSFLLGGD